MSKDKETVDDPSDIPMERRKALRELPNVRGTGIGPKLVDGERTDEVVLIVFVEDKVDPSELENSNLVPETVMGVETDVQRSGDWTPDARTSTARPVMGGFSVGLEGGSGGSSSAALVDDLGNTVLLTNRHVAANAEEDSTGSNFVQPSGPDDDGTGGIIGTVQELGTWSNTTTNTTDSALIDVNTAATNGNISSELLGAATLGASEAPNFSDRYVNTGRTTGLTSSQVAATDVETTVTYNRGTVDEHTKDYTGLVAFEPAKTDGGDSGSLHVRINPDTGEFHPVALHFAGSSVRSLGAPWSAVEAEHGALSAANLPGKPAAPSAAGSAGFEVTAAAQESTPQDTFPILITNTGYDHLPERTVTLKKHDGTVLDQQTLQLDYAHSTVAWMDVSALPPGPHALTVDADVEDVETVEVDIIDSSIIPHDVTVSVTDDVYGDPITGTEVFLDGESIGSTDLNGDVTTQRVNGTYTVSISLDGFDDYTGSVTVDGTATTHAAALAHVDNYTPPSDSNHYGQTDANGEITFTGVKAGSISHEFAARGYTTQSGSGTFDVDSTVSVSMARGTSTQGDGPAASAPKLNIPGNESFFETTALAPQTDDAFRIPVLVSNAGGANGETELTISDADGNRTDSQTIDLVSGDARVTWLSARLLFERSASIPVRARIETADDLELVDIYPGAEAEIITGPGRPATMGAPMPATMGGPLPATMGRLRRSGGGGGEDLARVENGWGVTLVNPGQDRLKLEAINDPSLTLTHTALNDWQLDVPADPELEGWTFDCEVYITFDGQLVFAGYCHDADASSSDQATTLKGVGPAGDLTSGNAEFSITHSAEWRAIEEFLAEFAPEWDVHIVRPDDSTIIYEEEVSGTPLECLETLCKDYGMFFRVDLHQHKSLTVFPPTGVTAASEILVEEFDRSKTSKGYANAVEVTGALRPDAPGRYKGRYTDRPEIRRLATELGISEEDATEVVPIRDSSIESDRQAHSRAKAKTRELIERNELGGTLQTTARMLDPGIAWAMPWDDERAVGPYALDFHSPGSVVDLPADPFFEMRPGGGISLWCKADWSQLSDREVRLFGAWKSTGYGLRTAGSQSLTLAMDSPDGDHATASAYPDDPPPDGEWICPFWEWWVEGGVTYLRAGHDGEVYDTGEMDAIPAMPLPDRYAIDSYAYFGRWHNDYYIGSLEFVHFFEGPIPPEDRRSIARGGSVASENLLAKYPMDEGPAHEPETIYDVFSGFHGTADGVRTAGDPQTLHKLDLTTDRAKAEFERRFEPADVLRDVVKKQRKM